MRIYNQAMDTCIKTKPNHHDLIQPFNYTKITNGICPTITTRPEGLKTMICVVVKDDRETMDK